MGKQINARDIFISTGRTWADKHLGRQSHCCLIGRSEYDYEKVFIDECPFDKCVKIMTGIQRQEYLDGINE